MNFREINYIPLFAWAEKLIGEAGLQESDFDNDQTLDELVDKVPDLQEIIDFIGDDELYPASLEDVFRIALAAVAEGSNYHRHVECSTSMGDNQHWVTALEKITGEKMHRIMQDLNNLRRADKEEIIDWLEEEDYDPYESSKFMGYDEYIEEQFSTLGSVSGIGDVSPATSTSTGSGDKFDQLGGIYQQRGNQGPQRPKKKRKRKKKK
jgi:hypothetical protein